MRVLHSSSVPGQVAEIKHSTQPPLPLQSVPPFSEHAEPASLAGCPGVPELHTSDVHWKPSSTGVSVLSGMLMTLPTALHWSFWQSPAVWFGSAVPVGAKPVPHTLLMHVRNLHVVSVPAQSVATLQPTQPPVELQT